MGLGMQFFEFYCWFVLVEPEENRLVHSNLMLWGHCRWTPSTSASWCSLRTLINKKCYGLESELEVYCKIFTKRIPRGSYCWGLLFINTGGSSILKTTFHRGSPTLKYSCLKFTSRIVEDWQFLQKSSVNAKLASAIVTNWRHKKTQKLALWMKCFANFLTPTNADTVETKTLGKKKDTQYSQFTPRSFQEWGSASRYAILFIRTFSGREGLHKIAIYILSELPCMNSIPKSKLAWQWLCTASKISFYKFLHTGSLRASLQWI